MGRQPLSLLLFLILCFTGGPGFVAFANRRAGEAKTSSIPKGPQYERNIDYYGSDIDHTLQPSPGACHIHCLKIEDCVAFTYQYPEEESSDIFGQCYTKFSTIGRRASATGQSLVSFKFPSPNTKPYNELSASTHPDAVVIRAHNMSRATISRVISWARQLNKEGDEEEEVEKQDMDASHLQEDGRERRLGRQWKTKQSSNYDVYVSIDVTYSCGKRTLRRMRQALKNENSGNLKKEKAWILQIHTYDEATMVEEFPKLHAARIRLPRGRLDIPGKREDRSMAWGFHSEALALWHLKHNAVDSSSSSNGAYRSSPGDNRYRYVWEDVGVTGDIRPLLNAYASEDRDFIASELLPITATWYFYPVALDEFVKKAEGKQLRANTREHVQRFSSRIIHRMVTWSKEGAIAWSEETPAMICLVEGLSYLELYEDHLGDPYRWDGHVTKEDFHNRMKVDFESAQNSYRQCHDKEECERMMDEGSEDNSRNSIDDSSIDAGDSTFQRCNWR
eukprot:jgi/Bigna1/67329/fgenesh1_pg.3_\